MMVEFLQNQYIHTLLTQHPSAHFWHNTRTSTHSWHNTPRHTTDTAPLETLLTQHPSKHYWHSTPRNTTDTAHPSKYYWHNTPRHTTDATPLRHTTDTTPLYISLTPHPTTHHWHNTPRFLPSFPVLPFSPSASFLTSFIRPFAYSSILTPRLKLLQRIFFLLRPHPAHPPTRPHLPPGNPHTPHPAPTLPSFRQYNYGKTIFVLICTLSHETQFGSRDKNAAEFCSLNYWRCLSLTRTDVASAWCVHNDAWRRQFPCTKNQRGKTTGTSRNYATTMGKKQRVTISHKFSADCSASVILTSFFCCLKEKNFFF